MVLFDIHKPVIAQIHGNCLAREWCRSSAWQLRSMRVVTSLAGSASRGSRKGGRAALSPPLLRNATRGSWIQDGPAKGFATKSSLDGRLGGKFGFPGAKL